MKNSKSKRVDEVKPHKDALGKTGSARNFAREKSERTKKDEVPTELLKSIYDFLQQHGYERTGSTLESEYGEHAKLRRIAEKSLKDTVESLPSLVTIYLERKNSRSIHHSELNLETDSSPDESSSGESSSLTPSTSSGDSEDEGVASESISEISTKKRKRSSSSVSSSNDSISTSSSSPPSSSEESSEPDSPRPLKRLRTHAEVLKTSAKSGAKNSRLSSSTQSISAISSSSANDGGSSSGLESSSALSRSSNVSQSHSSSRSSTSSSEDSSLESDSSKGQTPVISSSMKHASTSSLSASDASSSNKATDKERLKQTRADEPKHKNPEQRRKNSTDSSTTLLGGEGEAKDCDSAAVKKAMKKDTINDVNQRQKHETSLYSQDTNYESSSIKRSRNDNTPFSRIPKDIKVDERFAANLYMPNAANQQVYQDLRSTKGKGFTKEKNKKKRGSRFSGGKIDIHSRETLKFDD